MQCRNYYGIPHCDLRWTSIRYWASSMALPQRIKKVKGTAGVVENMAGTTGLEPAASAVTAAP